jgi:hypothetical protein
MIIGIFGWIIFSIIIGLIGSSRKIGFGGAFFLSLLLSPLIGLIITVASKSNSDIEYQEKLLDVQKQQKESLEKISNQKSISNIADELKKIKELLDNGIINQEEFDRMKNILLCSIDNNKNINDQDNSITIEKNNNENLSATANSTTNEIEYELSDGSTLTVFQPFNTNVIVGCSVLINSEVPSDCIVSLKNQKLRYEIKNSNVLTEYYIESFKQKDGTLLELDGNRINGIIIGSRGWINNKPAPDGIYKTGLLSSVKIKDGVIVK